MGCISPIFAFAAHTSSFVTPTVYSAPARTHRSPSPVQSMNIFAGTTSRPDFDSITTPFTTAPSFTTSTIIE